MPYASKAQQRFAHTSTARKAGWSASSVKEFDSASKGKALPEKVKVGNRSMRALSALGRGGKSHG